MSLITPPDADERRRALQRLAGVQRRARAQQRRRVALVATAAVVVTVVVGLGISAVLRRSPTHVVRVAGTTFPLIPASNIPSDAVPWANLAPGPYSPPPPAPTTLPPTSSPPCRASQLTVTDAGTNGGGGHLEHYYKFTNASPTTCLLGGHPTVVASEPGHADVVATDGTFVGDGGPPGDVVANASSTLIIETDSACAAHPGGGSGAIYHHVDVALPGGGNIVIPGASLDVICGLGVAAFAFPVPSTVAGPDPIAALKVTLDAPQRLQAGTTAVYAVILANPTDAAVTLDPCPDFIQVLRGVTGNKDVHQLNCPAAKPIAAHDQEAFVMHLAVPDDAANGQTALTWNLVTRGGEDSASAVVEVQADPNRPAPPPVPGTPSPCSGSGVAQPPPCGPGVKLSMTYPYALYTHCGIPTIILDGQLWQPIAEPSGSRAPNGWGDPIETGTITVDKPGVHAHFDGAAPGHSVDFSGPNVKPASPSPSC